MDIANGSGDEGKIEGGERSRGDRKEWSQVCQLGEILNSKLSFVKSCQLERKWAELVP